MGVDETRVRVGLLLLGARLRRRRQRAGFQLAEFADRAGVSLTHLSDLERGNKMPTLATLDALAVALDTSVANLLRGVYPWGSSEPPTQAPTALPDGRAGRKIHHRKPRTQDRSPG